MQALRRDTDRSAMAAPPAAAVRFVAEEIGWLAEEAIAAARRAAPEDGGSRAIRGLHRVDPFARLARHPRLVGPAQDHFAHDIAIADSVLLLAGSLPPGPVFGLRAIVDLGASPLVRAVGAPDPTGLVTFQAGAADCGDVGLGRLLFVVDYVAATPTAPSIEAGRDDGLWPTPFTCAG